MRERERQKERETDRQTDKEPLVTLQVICALFSLADALSALSDIV